MTLQKDNWVIGIEQEIGKSPINKIYFGFVGLLSAIAIYFLRAYPDFLGRFTDIIFVILLIIAFWAILKVIKSPKNLDYMAYYLYQIGYEILDFEIENNYLKRNQKNVQNCSGQLSDLIDNNFVNTDYFVKNILEFFQKLNNILLRLNRIYSIEGKDDTIMTKLEGMSSEQFITEKEFISSNLIALANLIHKEPKILTQDHVNLADKIFNELRDVPEKPIYKHLSEYPKEAWIKLPYSVKILIFLGTVFGMIFIISSQILIYFGVTEQIYNTAMIVSGALTAAAFSKIDYFITRERIKFN